MKIDKKVIICRVLLYVCKGLMALCAAGVFLQWYWFFSDNPNYSLVLVSRVGAAILILLFFYGIFSLYGNPINKKMKEDIGSIPLRVYKYIIIALCAVEYLFVVFTLLFSPESIVSGISDRLATSLFIIIVVLIAFYEFLIKRKKK